MIQDLVRQFLVTKLSSRPITHSYTDAFRSVFRLSQELSRSVPVYIVGSTARKILLDGVIDLSGDVDLASSLTPYEIKQSFPNAKEIGVGVVTIQWEGKSYEHATFRKEGKYSDSRHPDEIELVKDLETDLRRRDCSINAAAFEIASSELYFFSQTAHDAKNFLVRTLDSPNKILKEDPLRAIRYARLMAYDPRLKMDRRLQKACRKYGEKLLYLPTERIAMEITKASPYLNKFILNLIELDIFKYVFLSSPYSDMQATFKSCASRGLFWEGNPYFSWASIAYHAPGSNPLRGVYLQVNFLISNDMKNFVSEVTSDFNFSRIQFWESDFDVYQLKQSLKKATLQDIANFRNRCSSTKLLKEDIHKDIERVERIVPLIKAEDLLKMGFKQSPLIKDLLDRCMYLQLQCGKISKLEILEALFEDKLLIAVNAHNLRSI